MAEFNSKPTQKQFIVYELKAIKQWNTRTPKERGGEK